MKDNSMLSQEEIDALLNNSWDEEIQVEEGSLSDIEIDTLGEIGNISIGNSATALSQLLNQKVEITTPSVKILLKNQLNEEFPQPYVAVVVDYTKGFSGSNLLVIKERDALIIADLMMGGDGNPEQTELNEIHLSALQEAMNQMMGSAATSMSTIFQKRVEISPPLVDFLNIPEGVGIENIPSEDPVVKVSFQLKVGNLIDSQIMQILPITFAKGLASEAMGGNADESRESQTVNEHQQPVSESIQPREEPVKHEPVRQELEWSNPQSQKRVQPAMFSHFDTHMEEEQKQPRNLNMLFDIPLQVTVELGRTSKLVREILELGPGSIIELDKLAGEPVDIFVNQRLVARGEVVVIDENFGVRVTEIGSKNELLNKMKD